MMILQRRLYSIRGSSNRLLPRLRNYRLNPFYRAKIKRFEKMQVMKSNQNNVYLKEDSKSVLRYTPMLLYIFGNPALIIERKMEMMNVFFGFEQANKYIMMDSSGKHVGYIAEIGDQSFTKMLARQVFRTHRAFKAHILDREGNQVLLIERPFSWVNSTIRIIDPVNNTNPVIGEVQQQWHPWRRKYNLFLKRDNVFSQFAFIDEPIFSWDFSLINQEGQLIGSVNRNFMGLFREMFTDTGNYVLRMDAVSSEKDQIEAPYSKQLTNVNEKTTVIPSLNRGLTLDERAVILATAISIDFDYFSKLSKSGTGISSFFPFLFPIFGGGTKEDSGEHPDSTSLPQDQNDQVSSEKTDNPEETKNWWELPPDDNVWGEGDHDPWGNANQDTEDNNSWGGFFEEDD
ncbi:hypothetical protein PCANB_002478 [Pneumocystis canis]|nr:hypothetical protein PCK1_002489 [Pneumocystis canis]KAG5438758.1 hypothetical protein PCANB_002478 [Pneumocystis canis]